MPDWVVKYWVQWLFGLITAALGAGYARLSKKIKDDRAKSRLKEEQDAKEMKALKDGMRSILRRQLISDCEEAISQKYCPVDRKTTISDMYDSFKALGDEVAIRNLKEAVDKLPTFPNQ